MTHSKESGSKSTQNAERLAYGRIKRSIQSRVKKRLNPSEESAKFLVFLSEKDEDSALVVLGALVDEIEKGNVKVYWAETEEGRKAMHKYGQRPPAILMRDEDGGWRVARITKGEDTVYIEF